VSFQKLYREKTHSALQKELGLKNPHAVPKLQKIVVNAGIGTYLAGEKDHSTVLKAFELITGQKPVINKSRFSISNFKLRKGMPVGVSVTLRRKQMYDFLERLVTYAAPRVRDFRGFPKKSFDGRGNYSFGIKEHLVFPEIPQDEVVKPFGLQITIATSASNDEDAKKLLQSFHFPFSA